MTIHKEGRGLILATTTVVVILNVLVASVPSFFSPGVYSILFYSVLIISIIVLLLVLQFFRLPSIEVNKNENQVLAPADGKVVVIEDTEEPEYLQSKRKQISIFMSPINVHVNRMPVGGTISYAKYHPGKYLVAWHPKSSTENERTTIAVKMKSGTEVLFRQIAGALARRIKWYVKAGQSLEQGDEFGFIKFGSRVDIFLPTNAKVLVKLGDITRGGKTVIAEF
ncbi:MAG: phosphatidylserine decarboxylase family protein [Cyclobacteriaceae bacterium]|nr:phosphatidylserine decarboxylase family protein [Cytophagales bacterium]MBX2900186.1 phosphatidylserine decarboxylase family protein [Cyclobacteriaceae bacterium]